MKKEEILAKAQEENSDEMKNFVQDKSMWWVFIAMGICLIAFSIIKQNMGQHTSDLTVTICAGACAGNIYRFAKLHSKKSLFGAIITGIGAVVCSIFFIVEH